MSRPDVNDGRTPRHRGDTTAISHFEVSLTRTSRRYINARRVHSHKRTDTSTPQWKQRTRLKRRRTDFTDILGSYKHARSNVTGADIVGEAPENQFLSRNSLQGPNTLSHTYKNSEGQQPVGGRPASRERNAGPNTRIHTHALTQSQPAIGAARTTLSSRRARGVLERRWQLTNFV